MPQFNAVQQLGEAVVGLIMLPFVLARGLFRLWQRWRAVPLHTKNQVRSGAGRRAWRCARRSARGCWHWRMVR